MDGSRKTVGRLFASFVEGKFLGHASEFWMIWLYWLSCIRIVVYKSVPKGKICCRSIRSNRIYSRGVRKPSRVRDALRRTVRQSKLGNEACVASHFFVQTQLKTLRTLLVAWCCIICSMCMVATTTVELQVILAVSVRRLTPLRNDFKMHSYAAVLVRFSCEADKCGGRNSR